MEGEGARNARKHRGTKRRMLRKVHLGIDEEILEIRAAEFTTGDIGPSHDLQANRCLATDGAYDRKVTSMAVSDLEFETATNSVNNRRPSVSTAE